MTPSAALPALAACCALLALAAAAEPVPWEQRGVTPVANQGGQCRRRVPLLPLARMARDAAVYLASPNHCPPARPPAAGSGFLIQYYAGAMSALLERGVVKPGQTPMAGRSGGAFTAVATTLGLTAQQQFDAWTRAVRMCHEQYGDQGGCIGNLNKVRGGMSPQGGRHGLPRSAARGSHASAGGGLPAPGAPRGIVGARVASPLALPILLHRWSARQFWMASGQIPSSWSTARSASA